MCLLGAKAVGRGAHPKQSLDLKAKLLSLGGTPMPGVPMGPLLLHTTRVGVWLVPGPAEQQPKVLVSCSMLGELN